MGLDLHPEFIKNAHERPYLLGVSGGRDSVALLHALIDAGIRRLTLCHLNHGLRGEDAEQDASLVQQLARSFELNCEIGHADVPAMMQHNGDSMELAARKARHVFFADCAKTHGCSQVLLAHHADDQAETILFNLLRGSAGLRGMHWQQTIKMPEQTLQLIRPLLGTPRAAINAYLEKHQIPYRDDPSNAEPIAARNRIRHEVMPLLRDIMQRDPSGPLARALEVSESHEHLLERMVDQHDLTDPQGRLFLPNLAALPLPMQRIALRRFLQDHATPEISHDLLLRCQSLISDPQCAKINLPGGLFLRRSHKRIFISAR